MSLLNSTSQAATRAFFQRRTTVLQNILEGISDKSPKGCIDEPIYDMVSYINTLSDVYTTSSCSGRITLFKDGTLTKGGEWLVAKHGEVTYEEIFNALYPYLSSQEQEKVTATYPHVENSGLSKPVAAQSQSFDTNGSVDEATIPTNIIQNDIIDKQNSKDVNIHLLFEGFVLAVETRTLEAASRFLTLAHESGYRESGISAVAKRFIVNVRGSLRLDIPIILQSKLVVSFDYILTNIMMANSKMRINVDKIARFETSIIQACQTPDSILSLNTIDMSSIHTIDTPPTSISSISSISPILTTVVEYSTSSEHQKDITKAIQSNTLSSNIFLSNELSDIVVCVSKSMIKDVKDVFKSNSMFKRSSVTPLTKDQAQHFLLDTSLDWFMMPLSVVSYDQLDKFIEQSLTSAKVQEYVHSITTVPQHVERSQYTQGCEGSIVFKLLSEKFWTIQVNGKIQKQHKQKKQDIKDTQNAQIGSAVPEEQEQEEEQKQEQNHGQIQTVLLTTRNRVTQTNTQ